MDSLFEDTIWRLSKRTRECDELKKERDELQKENDKLKKIEEVLMEHDCFECDRCGKQEPGRLACFDMVCEACLREERDKLKKGRNAFEKESNRFQSAYNQLNVSCTALLKKQECLDVENDKLREERDGFKKDGDDLALKLFKRTGERNEAKEERDYFEGRCDIIVESCNKLKKENDKLKDRIPASVRTSKPVKACSSCVHRHVCTDYVPCLGTFVSKPLPPYRNWKLEKEF